MNMMGRLRGCQQQRAKGKGAGLGREEAAELSPALMEDYKDHKGELR